MTYYIFQEPSPGVVVHTAASKALAEMAPLGQLAGMVEEVREGSWRVCGPGINLEEVLEMLFRCPEKEHDR